LLRTRYWFDLRLVTRAVFTFVHALTARLPPFVRVVARSSRLLVPAVCYAGLVCAVYSWFFPVRSTRRVTFTFVAGLRLPALVCMVFTTFQFGCYLARRAVAVTLRAALLPWLRVWFGCTGRAPFPVRHRVTYWFAHASTRDTFACGHYRARLPHGSHTDCVARFCNNVPVARGLVLQLVRTPLLLIFFWFARFTRTRTRARVTTARSSLVVALRSTILPLITVTVPHRSTRR